LERYLAGQAAPMRVLTFPDGDTADSLDELMALAVKHWRYASGILHDGTMAHWLRRVLHDPVSAHVADEAVKQWTNSPDAALDAFLRQIDPSVLPPAKMELRTTSIRMPQVGKGQRIPRKIEVANRGQGYLRGEILSTQPWVKTPSDFTCPPGRICGVSIEIDTDGLAPGGPYLAAVTLTPVGGSPEVVAVQISVTAGRAAPTQIAPSSPTIVVNPDRVDFGKVDRKALSTPRVSLTVTNISQTPARIRVQNAPKWLLLKPETFSLLPGERQVVELVGRMDKVRARKHKVALILSVDGGRDQRVEVRLEVKRRGLFG
jgi:hypothetical protein